MRRDTEIEGGGKRGGERGAITGAKDHTCWKNFQQRHNPVHILARLCFPSMAILFQIRERSLYLICTGETLILKPCIETQEHGASYIIPQFTFLKIFVQEVF